MEWILFIFKRGTHHYLVSGESEEDAWNILQQRQSKRMEIIKKEYQLIQTMNGCQSIVKI